MTERYTRILSLDTMLYHEQSPIIFSKGALLADNHNKLFILQLQFENIQLKQISALEVEIICKNLDLSLIHILSRLIVCWHNDF